MHGFIPTGFIEAYITKDNPLAAPIAVLLGVPMYSNAAGVLTQHIEAYGVSPSKNRWVGNVPKFASLNEACKAAVTAEIENVDSTTKYSKVPENKIFRMCTLN